MKINLGKRELIHFIGIGGIGMSGLALIMNGLGFKVQGSNISENKNIDRLKQKKIPIFLNHNKKNLKNSTVLVISTAIKKNNPELVQAKKLKLPIYTRGEMLGHIVSLMKNIVVTGSHGKTTTTSLLSSIFGSAKLDPTIINGGVLNSFGNSAKLGKSNWSIYITGSSDGSMIPQITGIQSPQQGQLIIINTLVSQSSANPETIKMIFPLIVTSVAAEQNDLDLVFRSANQCLLQMLQVTSKQILMVVLQL